VTAYVLATTLRPEPERKPFSLMERGRDQRVCHLSGR
jgi:hypothetical protein